MRIAAMVMGVMALSTGIVRAQVTDASPQPPIPPPIVAPAPSPSWLDTMTKVQRRETQGRQVMTAGAALLSIGALALTASGALFYASDRGYGDSSADPLLISFGVTFFVGVSHLVMGIIFTASGATDLKKARKLRQTLVAGIQF